jgi:putative salt-induced outer membrane protein YdiY
MRVLRTEVFRVLPTRDSFWRQITGSVDYGFTFTSDNDQAQSSLGANATYIGEKNGFALNLTSSLNTQSNGPKTSRQAFAFDYTRLVSEKWFATLLTGLLHSSQQELELRTTLGAGFGRFLVRTERTRSSAFGGLVFSRERYSPEAGTDPRLSSAEAVLGWEFLHYRFDLLDLNTRLLAYPSLTSPGRVRVSSESNLSWKFVKDFHWNLRIYENFDSHPPIVAPKNDFGVTTSIGWTF